MYPTPVSSCSTARKARSTCGSSATSAISIRKGIDPSYTDYFGNSHDVQQRQDVQLNKFFLPFSGWFLTPKFRYYLYVWSTNASQGEPAQVVGAR